MEGRVSWFGGPGDPTDSGHTASGGTTREPGIAVYNRGTLGGYWRVTGNNGRTSVLKQTDIGPAPWTGRKIDVTYSALGHFGYNQGNFPTDSTFKAEYLGKQLPKGVKEGPTGGSGTFLPGSTRAGYSLTPGTPGAFNESAFKEAVSRAQGLRLLGKAGKEMGVSGVGPITMPTRAEFTTPGTAGQINRTLTRIPGQFVGGEQLPVGHGYVHPLPKNATLTSTDMGVDASMKPGDPIRAIGNGRVLGISPNWYAGQPYLDYELTDGPMKGQVIYVAEQIAPTVSRGQRVSAGQTIAHFARTGTGIETGFGTRGWQTAAQAKGETKGESGGRATREGVRFNNFLKQLSHG